MQLPSLLGRVVIEPCSAFDTMMVMIQPADVDLAPAVTWVEGSDRAYYGECWDTEPLPEHYRS